MAKKRKTLPDDFADKLVNLPFAELQALFTKRLELDAQSRDWQKINALGFEQCSDELTRWLVEQGLAVDTPNLAGVTPLAARARTETGNLEILLELGAAIEGDGRSTPLLAAAGSIRPGQFRALAERGASLEARDIVSGFTPLEKVLAHARLHELEPVIEIADFALSLPNSQVTDTMRKLVRRLGTEIESWKASGDLDDVERRADAGVTRLYELFGVDPVNAPKRHDGVSSIAVTGSDWRAQHKELWDLLVPSGGAAATVQGEVLRISGRVGYEILNNGGANWDKEYRKMLAALLEHLGSGTSLPQSDLDEARRISNDARNGDLWDKAAFNRLSELAVSWVLANTSPVPLPSPPYSR